MQSEGALFTGQVTVDELRGSNKLTLTDYTEIDFGDIDITGTGGSGWPVGGGSGLPVNVDGDYELDKNLEVDTKQLLFGNNYIRQTNDLSALETGSLNVNDLELEIQRWTADSNTFQVGIWAGVTSDQIFYPNTVSNANDFSRHGPMCRQGRFLVAQGGMQFEDQTAGRPSISYVNGKNAAFEVLASHNYWKNYLGGDNRSYDHPVFQVCANQNLITGYH